MSCSRSSFACSTRRGRSTPLFPNNSHVSFEGERLRIRRLAPAESPLGLNRVDEELSKRVPPTRYRHLI
jgi:hypothetical protein